MNRREFGLSIGAAVIIAQQVEEAMAQVPARAPSRADTLLSARMRLAARNLLQSLDAKSRESVIFPLAGDRRTNWSNLPVSIAPRTGVSVASLNDTSRRRLHDLIRASVSSQGYFKIAAIMRNDDILRADELEYLKTNAPKPRAGRSAIESMGSGSYWFAFFGDPAADAAWAWMITGHHLGVTFTCVNDRMIAAPLFLGAQPLELLSGPYAGFAILGHEAMCGLDLVNSLRPEQTKIAVLSPEPHFSDVLAGVGRRNSLSKYEGLPARDMDDGQVQLLMFLIEEFVKNADHQASKIQLETIRAAGIGEIHFSWRGPTDDIRNPFYFRVHGPRVIIEFAVQEPNHVHTIMRDPINDYAMDWLGMHYEEHVRSFR